MFSQEGIQSLIDGLVLFATDLLIPTMFLLFFVGIFMRGLVYYTLRREAWFAREFEKRLDNFLDSDESRGQLSFFVVSKRLLERTYYELFEVRAYMKRRKPDFIMAMSDRVFLIKQGAAWFVHDILKQVRHLRFDSSQQPKLFEVAKKTFGRNPCFSKVFGIVPASVTNDILNILPGIFIIGGIFGTFLGIMKALPDLGDMNLEDVVQTKLVMDQFLLKISFSMSTSLIGIILSVFMSFLNASLSPEKIFVETVDRFESCLDTLWNVCTSNDVPENLPQFDENRDPIEALAEQSIQREITLGKKTSFSKDKSLVNTGAQKAS